MCEGFANVDFRFDFRKVLVLLQTINDPLKALYKIVFFNCGSDEFGGIRNVLNGSSPFFLNFFIELVLGVVIANLI